MGLFFSMTLPALVIALTLLGLVEQAVKVRRRRRASAEEQRRLAAGVGADPLALLFSPAYKHKLEYDESREVHREEAGEDAPPRSHVDLDAGVARLVIPAGGKQPRSETDSASAAEPREK